MINVLKFSQFENGGNLTTNDIVVGLGGGLNTKFIQPWSFLPPGSTADRPPITAAIYYLLRFNTDTQAYEYYDPNTSSWLVLATSIPIQFPWTVINSSQSLVTNHGYFANGSTLLSLGLPSASSVGDNLAIANIAAGGFTLTQVAGQSIIVDPLFSTPGSAGSVSSATPYTTIHLVCVVANTTWITTGRQGTVTIV